MSQTILVVLGLVLLIAIFVVAILLFRSGQKKRARSIAAEEQLRDVTVGGWPPSPPVGDAGDQFQPGTGGNNPWSQPAQPSTQQQWGQPPASPAPPWPQQQPQQWDQPAQQQPAGHGMWGQQGGSTESSWPQIKSTSPYSEEERERVKLEEEVRAQREREGMEREQRRKLEEKERARRAELERIRESQKGPAWQPPLPPSPPSFSTSPGNQGQADTAYGGVRQPPPVSAPVPGRNLAGEYLQFTAFHSRVVPTATWSTLLVYASIESALQAVRADAAKFKDELGSIPGEVNVWASHPITRGARITIVPECEGITFNPERQSFTWVEDWQQMKFRFQADRRLAGLTGDGEVTIYVGPLIIASLKLSFRFVEPGIAPSFGQERNLAEVSAYLYKRIFTSYSHSDTPVVLACRNAYKALGLDSLIDIDNLRSGQRWNAALMEMIESADLFQLFWSVNAAQSPYVRQEWQHALQHSRTEGFIRPVYWEKPLVSPPGELSHLHFAYVELPRLERANVDKRPEALLGMIRIERGKEPGRVYEIRKDSLSIGRSRESDLFLEDLGVSRLHASIINVDNRSYMLKDEGSANGTRLNEQLINKHQTVPLAEGDRIQVGQTLLTFFKQ